MGIFQKTRRTDGNRTFDNIEKRHQVFNQTGGKAGTQEIFQDRFVIHITQCDRIQFVCLHKFVEDVCTDHDRLRNGHSKVIVFQLGITLYHRPNKRQTPALSSQRTVAYTGKVTIFVEALLLIDCNNTGILHPTVLHDQVENQLARLIHILVVAHIHTLQHLCRRKHGTGIEEAGKMVTTQMINQRIVRYLKDLLLQILQVLDAHDLLLRLWIQDDEIAETKTLHDLLPQILRITLGIFVDKGSSQFFRIHFVACLRRFQDKRDDQAGLPHILPELVSGVRIFHSVVHEAHVRDDPQHIIAVLVEDADSLLIGTRQLDLGTPTHTKCTLMVVQRLFSKHLALFQYKFIQMRQSRRIETDGIFHQQDNLHTNTGRIVRRIHLVLDQLDYGEQQLRISQPAEHIVDRTQIFIGNPLGYLFREWGEDYDRYIGVMNLDLRRRRKDIAVIHIRHADDQFEVTVFQLSQCLLLCRHLCETRRVTKA